MGFLVQNIMLETHGENINIKFNFVTYESIEGVFALVNIYGK